MKKKLIFGTCLSRSGGSLASNMLTCHKSILITTDLFHFFRFVIGKYQPINKYSNQYKLIQEVCLRLKIRNKITINPKEILRDQKINSYKDILNIFSELLRKKIKGKKHIGEVANNEWRNIENFLKMSKEHKAFQIIRDPRAILASWKNLTYSKGYKYLNIIFQWIDAANYSEMNIKKFPRSFMIIKFEDIHNNPNKLAKKFCKFLGVNFDKNMVNEKNWPKLLNNKFVKVNVSSYSKKKIYGFSLKRTQTWKKKIEKWEIALIQHLMNKYLKKFNYEIIPTTKLDLKKGLDKLKKDKLLYNNYKKFLKTGKGSNKFLKDPTKPENWGITSRTNLKQKFTDTNDYRRYVKNLRVIEKEYIRLKIGGL
tara:strand:- start:236 stop:1336 length:1101 start_codon:yes stop_codon:yes gene_type:complete